MSSIREIMEANTDSEDLQGITRNYSQLASAAAATTSNIAENDEYNSGRMARNVAINRTNTDERRRNVFLEHSYDTPRFSDDTRTPAGSSGLSAPIISTYNSVENGLQSSANHENIRDHISFLNNSYSASRVFFENAGDDSNNTTDNTALSAAATAVQGTGENSRNAMLVLRDPLTELLPLQLTSSTSNSFSRRNNTNNGTDNGTNFRNLIQSKNQCQNNRLTTATNTMRAATTEYPNEENILLLSRNNVGDDDNELQTSIGTRNHEASDSVHRVCNISHTTNANLTSTIDDDGDDNFITFNRHRNKRNAATAADNEHDDVNHNDDETYLETVKRTRSPKNAKSRLYRHIENDNRRKCNNKISDGNDDKRVDEDDNHHRDDDERLFRIKRKLDVVFIMNQVRQMFGDKNQMYSEQLLQDFKELFEQDLSSNQIAKIFILLKRQATSMCSAIHFVGNVISDVIKDHMFTSILGDRLMRQFSECFDNFLASTTMDGFFVSDVLTASDDKLKEIVHQMPGSWMEMGRFIAGLGFSVVAKLFADNVCAMIKSEKSKLRFNTAILSDANHYSRREQHSFPLIKPMPYSASDLQSVDVETNQLNSPLYHIPGTLSSNNYNSTNVESTTRQYARRQGVLSGSSVNDDNYEDDGSSNELTNQMQATTSGKSNNLVISVSDSSPFPARGLRFSSPSQQNNLDETLMSNNVQTQQQLSPSSSISSSSSSIYSQSPSRVGKLGKKKRKLGNRDGS